MSEQHPLAPTPTYRPGGVRLPVPEAWARAIAEFLEWCEVGGRPRSSRNTYRSLLEHFARRAEGGPWEQDRHTVRAYFAAHPHWAQDTRRSRKTTLKLFYAYGEDEGYLTENPAARLPKMKPSKPAPKPTPDSAYQAALASAPPRERLMLQLSHEIGMRREEVSMVHSRDVWEDFDGGWMLTVHGKGAKVREQPLPDALARALRALPEGYAFPGRRAGHLSAEYVGKRIAALLPGAHHMHGLRHSYATRLYARAGDITVVQEALGHESPATTMHYVVTDNRAKLRALQNEMSRPQVMRATG